ncbi:MAG: lytic murein transglycosylase [Rhodobacteraceae bacterium]|nr:lytic murein transglycosylase [Paracoccaceae bacterium]
MRLIFSVLATLSLSSAAYAAQCGGSFDGFVNGLKSEARDLGYSNHQVNDFFSGVAQDPKVIKADRSQGVFQLPFLEFSDRLISKHRRDHGAKNLKKYKAVFDRIERDYGISRGVLTAFWAFETDFGAFQGDFNTLNALVTLSHDCRRPELFRPQVFAAHMLSNLGWRAGQPWLQEVVVPNNLPWAETGLDKQKSVREWKRLGVTPREGRLGDASLQASIILPQGRKGPAFIAYPNFQVYFEWNQSFTYVTTAAYFATRLEGASPYIAGSPDPALSGAEMKQLQMRLQARGYNVGKVDGILGANTRAAVQDVQQKLGLPADAWPTHELLNRL